MPGKSQLEKFSSDLLSLGDEVQLRAARGEQPLKVVIPKDISDENDSEDFVLGMPLIEVEEEVEEVDEDLSDLSGLGLAPETKEGEEEAPAPSFEAPDMSSLLDTFESPVASDGDMPDLSMFADEVEPEEEEEVVEEEPEEVSIADMGLDALLSGGGFDEENEEETAEEEEDNEPVALEPIPEPSLIDDLNDFDDLEEIGEEEPVVEEKKEEEDMFNIPLDSTIPPIDDTPNPFDDLERSEDIPSLDDNLVPPVEDFNTDDIDTLDDVEELEDINDTAPLESLSSLDNKIDDDIDEEDVAEEIPSLDEELPSLDDEIPSLDENEEESSLDEELPSIDDELPSLDEEIPTMDEELPSLDEELPSMDEELPSLDDELPSEEELPSLDEEELPSLDDELPPVEEDNSLGDMGELGGAEDFNLDDMDLSTEGLDNPLSEDVSGGDDDFGLPPLTDLGSEKEGEENQEPKTESGISVDDFALPEDNVEDNGIPEFDNLDLGDLPDLDSPVVGEEDTNVPEGLFDANDVEFDAKDEIPDSDEFSLDNFGGGEELPSLDGEDSVDSLETFDTSEMDSFDFTDIPDTDTQLSGSDDDSSFDIPKDDGIGFDEGFEIPGFSDVETIKEQKSSSPVLATSKNKKQKGKKTQVSEEDLDEEETELPPNTLSDKQYRQFRKNLSEYPLNVRLAFEDFIVQDEFTDDAEFEVIEKILNKAPARQVAGTLEKMLDISIPVPRDYEHRSAEEYEQYKKSISYQLKNKIIPAFLLGIVGVLVCIGLFNFGKNCIYRPLKANSLYKQGYVLLQETEYPLSEVKFNEATQYRLNKNWFYKYARGYREHKQYQRAGKMYQNILTCFKHDKEAGLEYADMELNDLANYERAEEIVRREILDYHINDADGVLMLGDIFLEWATEKDPSKFEDAREQYASLIQLYGATDLYLSRMMRYFIRTDNLREVLQLKQNFEPREKSLCADDWTELSGYLLDKYYGELAPSEEYLRYQIEGIRGLLLRAVKLNPENPIALYNLGRYFIKTNEYEFIERTLQDSIEKFNAAEKMKSRDIYKYIDAYRLLGEHYVTKDNFLQAQEQFAEGISLYIAERDNAGFKGTPEIGKLYEDMGDIKYSVSGDYDDALLSYTQSTNLGNDSPKIRYRMGYINYNKRNYEEALSSFMKAGDGFIKERNLLLAMANTLSLRGDDYAAEGYYEQLMESLDNDIASEGILIPQARADDFDLVSSYLYGSNNYGVTLHRLAKKTGDSSKNAEAIVQLSESLKAWDALTRNPETMVRLEGTNLAEQNIKYITHPHPEFEPEIYTNISKTLLDTEKL